MMCLLEEEVTAYKILTLGVPIISSRTWKPLGVYFLHLLKKDMKKEQSLDCPLKVILLFTFLRSKVLMELSALRYPHNLHNK